MSVVEAALVLADGSVFDGEAIGAEAPGGVTSGEVVFNTVLSGYQEVITDPSYAGQIVAFTYPHIGNYGVCSADDESRRPSCRGIVVRDLARRHSSWRADGSLSSFLEAHAIAGIAGVDTRRLTRHVREAGAMPAAFGTADVETLTAAAAAEPGTDGRDLVATVTVDSPYELASDAPRRVVAYDFGMKSTILAHLRRIAAVTVVPASTPAEAVLELEPDGVFLSNGPGDPAAVPYASESIRGLLGGVPVFGICLGHQLMSAVLGAETYKLPFGHHGGNHPVRRLADSTVEITSQNHNYAVAEGSIVGADVTHVNLNDGVVEGVECRDVPAFSVQYHPEAGPGPHDSRYLFAKFAELIDRGA